MKVVRNTQAARGWFQKQRAKLKRIVFVPTMGALHEGHLSLVARARRLAGRRGIVAVSIFVNPTQFGPREDYRNYPRPFARDLKHCRKAGVDAVFAPRATHFYANNHSTWVSETELSSSLCGASRPGHFRGVCTVVAKLFNVVGPDIAVFGQKDYQQAQVVRRMVRDLGFPVKIVVAPTVRGASGLALSSRNTHLNAAGRKKAARIAKALRFARALVRRRSRPAAALAAVVRRRLKDFKIDYVAVVDAETLEPVRRARRGNCIAAAVFLGKVRLIDNITL